jgi:hypothetical protein
MRVKSSRNQIINFLPSIFQSVRGTTMDSLYSFFLKIVFDSWAAWASERGREEITWNYWLKINENISTKDFNAWQIGNKLDFDSSPWSLRKRNAINLSISTWNDSLKSPLFDIHQKNRVFEWRSTWVSHGIAFPLRYWLRSLEELWLPNKRKTKRFFSAVPRRRNVSEHFVSSWLSWKANLWRAHNTGHFRAISLS